MPCWHLASASLRFDVAAFAVCALARLTAFQLFYDQDACTALRQSTDSSGFLTSFRNNFTTNPVSNADMIVPSLVPTMVKSKKMNESKTASITQVTSKAILTLPNSLLVVSEIALTKASPELRITFAVTESDIPNPSMMIPISTIVILVK